MFGYFAFEGLEKELLYSLSVDSKLVNSNTAGGGITQAGRLFLCEYFVDTPWAQTILTNVQPHAIESISKAANFLKSQDNVKRWYPYAYQLHRRTELIANQSRKPVHPEISFLQNIEKMSCGHWLLQSETQMLYSTESSHPLPWGEVHMKEDKGAPSRAYLKLWEGFTLHVKPPTSGTVVVDMGSSPGGWTWVLDKLNCEIHSVDRSPLRDELMAKKNIHHRKADVFKLTPKDLPDVEWFFSDVICYPDKLLEWINVWLDHPKCKNFFVTIKFQGKTDFETLAKFQSIPNSKVIHMFHNKHELTWIHQR